jgi:hypothetical protein
MQISRKNNLDGVRNGFLIKQDRPLPRPTIL